MTVLKKWNAILRHKYKVIPESLSEEMWAKLVNEYRFVEEREREQFREDIEQVLSKLMLNKK